jgi:hypothetical protein
MMAGTSKRTNPGVWTAGDFYGANGTINGVAVASDTMLITGVVVLPGIEAPTAERSPLIMRPYDQELVACRRYYQKIGGEVLGDIILQGVATGASQPFSATLSLVPTMRAAPTAVRFGTWTDTNVTFTSFFPSKTSLGWNVQSVATGQFFTYGNLGGFACDARL